MSDAVLISSIGRTPIKGFNTVSTILVFSTEQTCFKACIHYLVAILLSNSTHQIFFGFTCDIGLSDGVSQATVTYVFYHICYLPPCGGPGIEFSQPAIHNLHHRLTVTAYLTHTDKYTNANIICKHKHQQYMDKYSHTTCTNTPLALVYLVLMYSQWQQSLNQCSIY